MKFRRKQKPYTLRPYRHESTHVIFYKMLLTTWITKWNEIKIKWAKERDKKSVGWPILNELKLTWENCEVHKIYFWKIISEGIRNHKNSQTNYEKKTKNWRRKTRWITCFFFSCWCVEKINLISVNWEIKNDIKTLSLRERSSGIFFKHILLHLSKSSCSMNCRAIKKRNRNVSQMKNRHNYTTPLYTILNGVFRVIKIRRFKMQNLFFTHEKIVYKLLFVECKIINYEHLPKTAMHLKFSISI